MAGGSITFYGRWNLFWNRKCLVILPSSFYFLEGLNHIKLPDGEGWRRVCWYFTHCLWVWSSGFMLRGGSPRRKGEVESTLPAALGCFAWNQANLCCTKLLSCAEKQAPDELILCLHDDNQRLGRQPRGETSGWCRLLSFTCTPEPTHSFAA